MFPMPLYMRGAHPRHYVDQEFGVGLTPDDIMNAVDFPMMVKEYLRPWRQVTSGKSNIGSTITHDKDKFQVNLDVQHFDPEEISVKTVDGSIVVEAKHEEKKDDHGFISRHFTRRYLLPEHCDAATVESKLSSDGVLIITAPKVRPASEAERSIPISKTGPVRKDAIDAVTQPENQADANDTAK